MNEAQITDIVERYLTKRKIFCNEINDILNQERNKTMYPWETDRQIKELDNILTSSAERIAYNELHQRTQTDTEFEEKFREIHNRLI